LTKIKLVIRNNSSSRSFFIFPKDTYLRFFGYLTQIHKNTSLKNGFTKINTNRLLLRSKSKGNNIRGKWLIEGRAFIKRDVNLILFNLLK